MKSSTKNIFQYRVDFHPILDNVPLKKDMVAHVLGEDFLHIFEGTMVFTFDKIGETSEKRFKCDYDGNTYEVTFVLTSTTGAYDYN